MAFGVAVADVACVRARALVYMSKKSFHRPAKLDVPAKGVLRLLIVVLGPKVGRCLYTSP